MSDSVNCLNAKLLNCWNANPAICVFLATSLVVCKLWDAIQPVTLWPACCESRGLFRIQSNMELIAKIVSGMLDWVLNTLLESIISLWVGSRISLHHIKFALSLYVVSILHLRQTWSTKVIKYIPTSSNN